MIYDQFHINAEATADQLLYELLRIKSPFVSALKSLPESARLSISSTAELIVLKDAARRRVVNGVGSSMTNSTLLTLMQAIHYYYYGPSCEELQQKLPWLGTSLKSSLAFIWLSTLTNHDFSKVNINNLGEFIRAVALWQQIETVHLGFEIAGAGRATLHGNGIHTSGDLASALQEMNMAYEQRGRLHRTLRDSHNILINQMEKAFKVIEAILGGENPAAQPLFENTIFSQIPGDLQEFWSGLYARMYIAIICSKYNPPSSDIALFPQSIVTLPSEYTLPQGLINNAIRASFWDKKWYKKRIEIETQNMLIERPVVRVSSEPTLFVSTILNIGDSINWFVEASVMTYYELGGFSLPKFVFQRWVSIPFENEATRIFRNHGFMAGKVKENGVWVLENREIQLRHTDGENCPGEIDILARNLKKKLVVVADCKVLAYPRSPARMRNLVGKIGDQDDEGFHRKISKKMAWVIKVEELKSNEIHRLLGVLILDRRLPGMTSVSKNIVCDLSTLDSLLSRL